MNKFQRIVIALDGLMSVGALALITAFRLVILGLGLMSLYLLQNYCFKAFSINHFLEPAENENSFMIYLLKQQHRLVLPDILSSMKAGLMPVYPAIFHQAASYLPGDPLSSGRLLSLLCAFFLVFVLSSFFYYKTKDFFIALVLPLAAFGASPDCSYFFLNRVDSLLIFSGTLSLVCFTVYNDLALRRYRAYLFFLGVVASLVAILTKQTGIAFVVTSAVLCLFCKGKVSWKDGVYFGASLLVGLLLYYIVLDPDLLTRYVVGLYVYAKKFSSEHFLLQYGYYRTNYIHFHYALGALVASIVTTIIFSSVEQCLKKGQDIKIIAVTLCKSILRTFGDKYLTVLLLLTLVSVKLCGNDAAFMNNYYIMNIALLWYIAVKLPEIHKYFRWIPAILIAYGTLTALVRPVSQSTLPDLTARLTPLSIGSPLRAYVRSHPGRYVTSRSDDYVFLEGSVPIFEASVYLGVSYSNLLSRFPEINQAFKDLRDSIGNEIKDGNLQGIILGIQKKEMYETFPEIQEFYRRVTSENIKVGLFDLEMILLVPKKAPKGER